jgi:tripartite-type tricarboxylate transporter receptor subunit TctC
VSIIGAGTDAPFNDYKEMQAWAKANPNSVLAGGTLGSTSHFSLLQVQDVLGITMKIVSYDGTADRMKAMLANTIHIGQVSEATAAKNVQTGNLKVLAVNSQKRSPILTDTPTSFEQGFKVDIATDRGFMLPLNASDDVVKHYADLFDKVAHDPAYIKKVEELGSVVDHMGPADYKKWWQDTMGEWTAIAKRLGVYREAS